MQQHAASFIAHTEAGTGAELPRFVKDEFDAFLECGILAHGFLRLRCGECGHDKLLAFGCKRRGFCPSCGARRMAQAAAHLADHVIPHVPVRQWVLSLPIPLRMLLAARRERVTPIHLGQQPHPGLRAHGAPAPDRQRRSQLGHGSGVAGHAGAGAPAWMFHQVAPAHPRSASVSCGGSLHWARAAADGRGTAGWRGARAAPSLKRSPLPAGSGRAPVAQSGSRGHPRKSRVPDETSGLGGPPDGAPGAGACAPMPSEGSDCCHPQKAARRTGYRKGLRGLLPYNLVFSKESGMTESTITSKGQTTVPAEIRAFVRAKPGTRLVWSVMPDGTIIVRAKTKSIVDMAGMLKAPQGKRVSVEEMNPWR